MTTDLLERARRRPADLRRGTASPTVPPQAHCEISEKSEESRGAEGLISHNSLFSQSAPAQPRANDLLLRARQRMRELRSDSGRVQPARDDPDPRNPPVDRTVGGSASDTDCEMSEKSPAAPSASSQTADPFRAWRLRNAQLLEEGDDYGGRCAEHRRPLSYPEQKRGACSWCVGVDPEREPEYWASHWRRFTERP
jgi:hypothetical protein